VGEVYRSLTLSRRSTSTLWPLTPAVQMEY
jgi:hypothetical protein